MNRKNIDKSKIEFDSFDEFSKEMPLIMIR